MFEGSPTLRTTVRQRFSARVTAGAQPTVFWLGVNRLRDEEVTLFKEVWSPYSPLVVLVEPNPHVQDDLLRRMNTTGIKNFRVVNAALCASDASKVPFYTFSPLRFQHAPAGVPRQLISVMDEFASLDRTAALRVIQDASALLENCSAEDWADFAEHHVMELEVQCVVPATLLQQVQVAPASIDAIVVDVEGQEKWVLKALLELDGFQPIAIYFEWTSAFADVGELLQLVQNLAARGYDVYRNGQDIAAVCSGALH